MKTYLTLKYPIKIGGILYPKGYIVKQATLEETKMIFPDMTADPCSKYISVWFFDEHPTLIDRKSVIEAS